VVTFPSFCSEGHGVQPPAEGLQIYIYIGSKRKNTRLDEKKSMESNTNMKKKKKKNWSPSAGG